MDQLTIRYETSAEPTPHIHNTAEEVSQTTIWRTRCGAELPNGEQKKIQCQVSERAVRTLGTALTVSKLASIGCYSIRTRRQPQKTGLVMPGYFVLAGEHESGQTTLLCTAPRQHGALVKCLRVQISTRVRVQDPTVTLKRINTQ